MSQPPDAEELSVGTKRSRHLLCGFTLIELMIVVVVIAILASIAYPSYMDSVQKSRRVDAREGLMNMAQQAERRYTQQNAYPDSGAISMPTSDFYNFTYAQNNGGAGYTVSATATGSQTSDECAELTLTHTGSRTPTDCW